MRITKSPCIILSMCSSKTQRILVKSDHIAPDHPSVAQPLEQCTSL